MELLNLNPADFKSHVAFVTEVLDYTRCPYCGQYTCVCSDDEQDDSCHCGHPECGAC